MNKRIHFMRMICMLCSSALLALSACKPQEAAPSPTPAISTASATLPPVSVPSAKRVEVRVDQTTGMVMADTANTSILYGAVAYTNTGNCPITLVGASFAYTLQNDIVVNNSFTPIFSGDDVVQPGETGFLALWQPYDALLEAGQPLELSAELQAAEADSASFALDIKNARITQNYPGFSTVSGAIYNMHGRDCSLNMIYLAFYDEADKLLGVFHFTKDAIIPSGEFRNFVMQLQALPVENLAEKTATIRAHAFGME